MRTFRPLAIIMLLSSIILSSCGKEEYFKSEQGIKDQLQGSWTLIPIPRTDPVQEWTFSSDGKINRYTAANNATDNATYSVSTSLFKAEIKVESFSYYDYNGTWQIVRLDDNFLVIANDHDGNTGLMQLEFEKKK
jgi:hypothetical protein